MLFYQVLYQFLFSFSLYWKITNFIETSKIVTFKVVLLAAIEYNRDDDKDKKESVEGIENNTIRCDKNEDGNMTTNKEIGTDKLERNVEAAWTNKKASSNGSEKNCCISWYKIFRFTGKTEKSKIKH